MTVARTIEAVLGARLQIAESDLEEVRLEAAHSAAKAEAL